MRHRAFTYITRGQDLLLLDHVGHPELKPQIPGGTIENGEQPDAAALREAYEETGLKQLDVVRMLGTFERDLSDLGRKEVIVAWYFHLTTNCATPPRWRHFEKDPSDGDGPIEFELYWAPLKSLPKLGGIDDAFLSELTP